MNNKKVFVLLMTLIMIFTLTCTAFAESKLPNEADIQKNYKDLAEEIKLKQNEKDIQGSYEALPKEMKRKIDALKTSENKELLDNSISPQYEPIHECHSGPGHQNCKLERYIEPCGCEQGAILCCCGKTMGVYQNWCKKHGY